MAKGEFCWIEERGFRARFKTAGVWPGTLTFDRFSPAILPLLASEKQLQILRRCAPQDDSAWGRVMLD
jgi:hypothetical protein